MNFRHSRYDSLQAIPENTGLTLISDNRSGHKLEIVIPVLNEERRIGHIIEYYRSYDVVLLDGGSSDGTTKVAIEGGATVFQRVGANIGENHFTYYVNVRSKSGYCLYLMADELISKGDLFSASCILSASKGRVYIHKIEWIYGYPSYARNLRSPNDGMPRGVRKGDARYCGSDVHNSLRFAIDPSKSSHDDLLIRLDHLHIKSIASEYGKYGYYSAMEVGAMVSNRVGLMKFFRRYAVPFLSQTLWRTWRSGLPLSLKILNVVQAATLLLLAIGVWIEKRYCMTEEQQLQIFVDYLKINR